MPVNYVCTTTVLYKKIKMFSKTTKTLVLLLYVLIIYLFIAEQCNYQCHLPSKHISSGVHTSLENKQPVIQIEENRLLTFIVWMLFTSKVHYLQHLKRQNDIEGRQRDFQGFLIDKYSLALSFGILKTYALIKCE